MSYMTNYLLTPGNQVLLVPHTQHTCGIKNTWNLQYAMPVWERAVLDLVACEPLVSSVTTSLSHVCPACQFFLLLLFNCMCERGF